MPLIQEKLQQKKEEEKRITEKVVNENVRPSAGEMETAQSIIQKISYQFADQPADGNLAGRISDAVAMECRSLDVPFEEQKRIEKTVVMTVLGQGPIDAYLHDPEVTDIIVQRWDNIVVERNGKIEKVDASFNNDSHLRLIIERIVQETGRTINISQPIVDARLKDGSRVNATIPPVSPDGATLTIRKFSQSAFTGRDYVRMGSMDHRMLFFLERCVKGRISLIVSGGTGSGKTSMLNMLSRYIPDDELVITIEDVLELKLEQPNVRRMETRTTLQPGSGMMQVDTTALVKAALRQRPDRIILGETRDGSIVDMISAMSTGHEGSMCTIHANSPRNLCDVRIPNLFEQNRDFHFSERSIALQTAEALDIIVQVQRMLDGSRKVTHISQVDGITETGKVNIQDIFVYDQISGKFLWTGYLPERIIRSIAEKGWTFSEKEIHAVFTERGQ